LQQLQQRNKWHCSKGEQLNIGDMVLIQHEDSLPLMWIVGRIEGVHPGADGKARVASIKTAKGTYKRPITKLRIMSLEASS